jgi:hypothetical protein
MSESPALDLHARAREDLRAIRTAMEGSSRFTSVSGVGEVVVGSTALFAAWIASLQESVPAWLAVWSVEAAIAVGISLAAAAWKAHRTGGALWSLPARRFALSLAPPLVAGAALTPVLQGAGLAALLPGAWMLLYGTGVVTGGAFSVRIVPLTGLAFMLAGILALGVPGLGPDVWMAIGFGGIHIVFGALLAAYHGG